MLLLFFITSEGDIQPYCKTLPWLRRISLFLEIICFLLSSFTVIGYNLFFSFYLLNTILTPLSKHRNTDEIGDNLF